MSRGIGTGGGVWYDGYSFQGPGTTKVLSTLLPFSQELHLATRCCAPQFVDALTPPCAQDPRHCHSYIHRPFRSAAQDRANGPGVGASGALNPLPPRPTRTTATATSASSKPPVPRVSKKDAEEVRAPPLFLSLPHRRPCCALPALPSGRVTVHAAPVSRQTLFSRVVPSPFFKHVQCVRETEILVEQQPPQGVLVWDHAGLVINKFSLRSC